ncbi:VOC family protein [Saliterribacillus persicus]|uniref:Glyoxalase/bleomycin resistance protein/dioxygenase superfamily protein n=1 Tax=Saliterribacillus persicus TaxID=930114 RepID=A0A368YBY1_9BACI|nr:VOC family protein [Saliterribacillus persicus]RCW77199.1 glyoxalase/bleomycin resistance protein/dioxygenase superfamily protein [Saliterribacillus persicus]
MGKNALGTNVVTQIAIVVHDIIKTSQAYADFFDVEMPDIQITDGYDKSEMEHRNNPSQARAKLAFFDMGSLQLELIEPDHEPSTWREHLDVKGEGVHHIAFEVNGMKAVINDLEAKGMPLIQKGEYPGGRYAYMDTEKELKVLFELLEND